MKKTLSILLSLLMVLGTVTCLFTMPASAEAATTEATTTAQTLPVNDFITNNGTKTITPDTVWKYNDSSSFPLAVNFNIRGWNEKKDDDGNVISGQANSYIDAKVPHQLTFNVKVSDDATAGAKLFVDLYSQNFPQPITQLVGVRSDVTTPNEVETAYNFVTNIGQGTAGTVNSKADNAVALEAGKTYTYTYVFNANTDWVSAIAVFADGLTEGSVTLSNAKVFPLTETDAGNFYLKNAKVIPYAVEENGNVFTRMYGYRDIGSTATTKYVVSAALGGDYYNIEFKGGKTYELDFDARYTSKTGFHDSDTLGRSPAFDFFETGALDYVDDYAAIKDAADETVYQHESGVSYTDKQRDYSGPNNGYSYWYAGSTSATRIRRVTASNIGTMAYYNAGGALLAEKSQGAGSQHGRTFKDEDGINTSTWIKGVYTLNTPNAQTLQEAAVAGAAKSASTNANMRYTYADGVWTYNSAMKNWYVPAAQDVTVALGIEFLYAGDVYDFDNFAIKSDVTAVPVEYKNANGETDTLANTKHTATMAYDVLADKTTASINLFESDTVIFDGWYNGDTFLSKDAEIEIAGSYDDLKAVFTSKNLLTYAGGFENYADGTNLEAAYTVVKAGTAPYTNYTAGEFRYYNSVPPTGDKWTGWDTNMKSTSLKDSDSGVTTAKILEDIAKTGGVMNESGYTGFTYFTKFPTIKSTVSETIYTDGGRYSDNAQNITITPYSGDKMLQMQASSRTGFRALEGLTPGKTYTLSFYAFNPYKDYWLKTAAIRTKADLTADSKVLASYEEPLKYVTEDYVNDKGVTQENKTFSRISNMDHVQKWFKIELTFKATDTVAYLALFNQYPSNTNGHTFIDELTMVEYDCQGNHIYDDFNDNECNACGATREYLTDWTFENGVTENVTVKGSSKIDVVDAVDQPEKIGDKYLQYTSAGFDGMAFNFQYEQGYKYTISYDFKIFTYGTGKTSNGIDHSLIKFDDGLYGVNESMWTPVDESYGNGEQSETIRKHAAAALNPAIDNIITRYWEDGTAYEKVTCFSHSGIGENNFVGRSSKDGVYLDSMPASHGGAIWDEWQHVVIEVGTNNDYAGLVEYGIRPNDAGWVVGVDNFKVEKVATSTIDEANNATNGTYAFNIRAKTTDKQQGLRFKSTIDLNKLNLSDGAKIVEYGTLATKASNTTSGYFLRREAADAKNAKVVVGVAYNEADGTDIRYALNEETNVLTYTGVLTGIGIKNYDVDFAVCGYAIVELADGTRTTVYDDIVKLSVYDAAQQIVAESTDSSDIAVAQSVIDTYDTYMAK